MECQQCGERDAVVHLTQIVDNNVTTVHLCEQCAAEKGIESNSPVGKSPLGDFLAQLGKGVGAGLPADTPHMVCKRCGMTLQDFRDLGRLGCAECYLSFEAPLRELMRRLHGSTSHVGERYAPPGAPAESADDQAGELRERLRRAIENENFELAANLRDRLRELE